MLTEDKNYVKEYKLLSFTFDNGANREIITTDLQTASMYQNPAVDKTLTKYAADGWKPISMSNSGHGALFIMLGR